MAHGVGPWPSTEDFVQSQAVLGIIRAAVAHGLAHVVAAADLWAVVCVCVSPFHYAFDYGFCH